MSNKKAIEYIFSHCSSVQQICKPIFDLLQVKGFTYQKIFPDGSRIYLSESPEWLDHLIQKAYYNGTVFKNFVNYEKVMLWKHWPKEDSLHQTLFKDARENFCYDNGLFIHNAYEGYIETFTFRGDVNIDNSNNLYFSNMEIIKKFLDYFINNFQEKICVMEKFNYKIFLEQSFSCNEGRLDIVLDSIRLKERYRSKLIQDIENNVTLSYFNNKKRFSNMEIKCLLHLMFGSTAKEIGRDLFISNRTVEEYLKNIRFKLGTQTKSSIVKEFFKFGDNEEMMLHLLKSKIKQLKGK